MKLKTIVLLLLSLGMCIDASAQVDRHDVRAGNRKFRKDKFREAEIDYRKAVLKDSLSVPGQYNLASDLYRQEDYQGASRAMKTIKDAGPASSHASDYWYNLGDIALGSKDYASAVEAFKQALLLSPGDLDAKENYIYAKLMLQNQQNQQNGGGDGQDQNQNQDQDQDKDQNQDQKQNQDQDKNQNQNREQDQDQGQQPQEQKISAQQAQQMLKAIQAKEKETQEKVNKEKAELLQSRQKDKNW